MRCLFYKHRITTLALQVAQGALQVGRLGHAERRCHLRL